MSQIEKPNHLLLKQKTRRSVLIDPTAKSQTSEIHIIKQLDLTL